MLTNDSDWGGKEGYSLFSRGSITLTVLALSSFSTSISFARSPNPTSRAISDNLARKGCIAAGSSLDPCDYSFQNRPILDRKNLQGQRTLKAETEEIAIENGLRAGG